ncbi:MAG: flavin monoamine oxidase family protein [Magnetovibrionaceae bacterium]
MNDAVIIGGGLCGLAAATRLEHMGVDWHLVEARGRIGGRMKSVTTPGGAAYDLGPAWVWPHQQRILALAEDLGLTLFEQFSTGNLVYEDATGHIRRDLNFAPMAGALRIDGGAEALARGLASRLPESRLSLSSPVVSIHAEATGFRLAAKTTGDAPANFNAARILFALPPRLAVESIDLGPVVPADARQVLRAIPTWMAGHAKVLAVYDSPFWREANLSGNAMSQQGPLMEIHDASPASGSTEGALFGFVHPSLVAQNPPRKTLESAALGQLTDLFGPRAATPTAVHIKSWFDTPFTATGLDAGASPHPTGGIPTAISALDGLGLVFAGSELAEEEAGLIEGALHAAEQAVIRLNLRRQKV